MRTSITVPDDLLKEFDEVIRGKYATRNEAIRAGMMLLINKLREEKKGEYPRKRS